MLLLITLLRTHALGTFSHPAHQEDQVTRYYPVVPWQRITTEYTSPPFRDLEVATGLQSVRYKPLPKKKKICKAASSFPDLLMRGIKGKDVQPSGVAPAAPWAETRNWNV